MTPFDSQVIRECDKEVWQWAHMMAHLSIEIDNRYPSHPFISFCKNVPVHYFKRVYNNPITNAPIAFTDGAKGAPEPR